MIINFDNIGGSGGGGGQYVLPVATANRLGGIKVGSGLTIDAAGVLSTSGGTAPSGEGNVKVYLYDELYSGDTYDHYSTSVPDEMEALAKSGTPVYILYTGSNKSVYLGLTTYTGSSLLFFGADGTQFFHCTLAKNTPWTMSEMGRSRNGDYEVVSQLPATAQEGQVFFVPAHTSDVPATAYTFDCSQFEGGYQFATIGEDGVHFEPNGGGSGTFYWAWDNDGNWHNVNWGRYLADDSNGVFHVEVYDDSVVHISEDIPYTITITSGTTAITTTYPDETYRYSNGEFRNEMIFVDIDMPDLYDYLSQFEPGYIKKSMQFYRNGSAVPIIFRGFDGSVYHFDEGSHYTEPIGTPMISKGASYTVYDGGKDGGSTGYASIPISVFYDIAASSLTSNCGLWVRTIYSDETWGGNPIVLRVRNGNDDNRTAAWTQNCWFRKAYDGENMQWNKLVDGEVDARIFGAEWYQDGDKITAEWVVNGEGAIIGGAPINWTVASVHSAADSTIPTSNE